jgi:hypothetical protein
MAGEPASFLAALFSVCFGDGDPNSSFEQLRWRHVASAIQYNGGAVFAEQLLPYLDPAREPNEPYASEPR